MNSYFWNFLDLSTPVILSSTLNCNNPCGTVTKFKCAMISIKNTLIDLKQLDLEAAALSRLIYRTKYKLRQEKSFKMLQMINRCLTNYLSIHLPYTMTSLLNALEDDRGPSRQMLEWALTRLLSVAHLFHRVHSLCTQAAGHLFVRIKLAHMQDITFFAVAVVSRIWTYAQFIVRKTCEWYSSLYQFLDKLQPSSQPWLPEGVVLPARLEATLEDPAHIDFTSVSRPDELVSQLDSQLSETDKTQINGNLPIILDLDDIGETVSRVSPKENLTVHQEVEELRLHLNKHNTVFNSKKPQKTKLNLPNKPHKQPLSPVHKDKPTKRKDKHNQDSKISNTSYKHSIKGIRSSEDLIQFFEVESTLRKSSFNADSTQEQFMKNCDKLQWSMMEKFIKKQIKLLAKSEACGDRELQEKLLKRVRKSIKSLGS